MAKSKKKKDESAFLPGHIDVEDLDAPGDLPGALTLDESVEMATQLYLEEQDNDVAKPKVGFKPAPVKSTTTEKTGGQQSMYSGYTGTSTVVQCPIHKGHNVVFTLNEGKTQVCGAEKPHIDDEGAALVIDLTGPGFTYSSTPARPFVESKLDWFPVDELNAVAVPIKEKSSAPYVNFDWKDMSVPPVGFEFWMKLAEALPEGKVIIFCQGGHGRTGTALAALLTVTTTLSSKTIIDEIVRKAHCSKALETQAQCDYIAKLCGIRDEYLAKLEESTIAKAEAVAS